MQDDPIDADYQPSSALAAPDSPALVEVIIPPASPRPHPSPLRWVAVFPVWLIIQVVLGLVAGFVVGDRFNNPVIQSALVFVGSAVSVCVATWTAPRARAPVGCLLVGLTMIWLILQVVAWFQNQGYDFKPEIFAVLGAIYGAAHAVQSSPRWTW